MRLLATATGSILALAAGCRPAPAPTPSPTGRLAFSSADLAAVLAPSDLGPGWTEESGARPNTLQIGGRVGAASMEDARAEATSAFRQQAGSGYVTNTLVLLRSVAQAEAVMTLHRRADATTSWHQTTTNGGGIDFVRIGRVDGLPPLGDEMYTARLRATITGGGLRAPVQRTIEYVVYRVGPLLSFLATQDVGVATFARRQEAKVARLGA